MKSKSIFIVSSFLLAFGLTACPSGGGTGTGSLNLSFSNPSGTVNITQTPFSANPGVGKAAGIDATIIAGKQGNRLVTLSFYPALTANRSCTTNTECGVAIVENTSVTASANILSLNATLNGGSLSISGTATFTQTNGATFNATISGTMPYTP